MQRGRQGSPGSPAARALRRGTVLALAILALGSGSAAAAARTWRLARGPSDVSFRVGHLVFLTVEGRFRRFSGAVESPGPGFEGARIEAEVEVGSVTTGHRDRDRELRGEEFFAAASFPTIRFTSRAVERRGPRGGYRVVGDLTIRGVTREVVLAAEELERRRTARGERVRLVATGELNRLDFGMRWNDTWVGRAVLADTVEIRIEAALLAQPPPPTSTRP